MFYGAVSDFFDQAVISFLLGHRNLGVFNEFLENLESSDASTLIKLSRVRAAASESPNGRQLTRSRDELGESPGGGRASRCWMDTALARRAEYTTHTKVGGEGLAARTCSLRPGADIADEECAVRGVVQLLPGKGSWVHQDPPDLYQIDAEG